MAETIPPISVTRQKDVRIVEFTNNRILDEANIAEIGQTLGSLIDESERRQTAAGFCQCRSPELRRFGNADQCEQPDSGKKWAIEADEYQATNYGSVRHHQVEQTISDFAEPGGGLGELYVAVAFSAARAVWYVRVVRRKVETHFGTRGLLAGMWMGVAGSNRRGEPNPTGSSGRGDSVGQRTRTGRLVFTFDSNYASGRNVQNEILDAIRDNGFKGNTFFAINLALEEALTNAIRHGNHLDPAKKVRVEAKVTPKRVEIVVEDQGPGFDRRRIPDPTANENLRSAVVVASCSLNRT